jgi:PAS domain S-box-containing protein
MSDGVYLEVNEGFSAISGYSPDEVLGNTSLELQLWLDTARRQKIFEEIEQKGMIRDAEARFRRKDGTILVGLISARIIEIKDEPYILSITRDITERENIQKELLKAQKLESISILAGGIAHNFNNVLTGVIGYISYAKKHLHDTEKLLRILDSAEISSYRAAGLARQLLTFSRGSTPVRTPVAVDTLVKESVSLFLSGSSVMGIIDCSSHQTIFADSQQINQAFNNIVLNALQAMPDGGTLSVRADAITLTAGNQYALPPAAYVRISFADSGHGIDNDILGKVFDPYFTTKVHGTGLGLSSTHSIISKHGGSILISSQAGHGTVVTVILPASGEKERDAMPVREPGKLIPESISVLVMDDDRIIRDLSGEQLGDMGYQVTTCCNGSEAIEIFRKSLEEQRQFSISILDLVIPGGMGGIEAARQILSLDPYARLIASSGYSNDPTIADYKTYGFCGAIVKPYNTEELNRTLQSVLHGTFGS